MSFLRFIQTLQRGFTQYQRAKQQSQRSEQQRLRAERLALDRERLELHKLKAQLEQAKQNPSRDTPAKEVDPAETGDLMEALKKSLEQQKRERER